MFELSDRARINEGLPVRPDFRTSLGGDFPQAVIGQFGERVLGTVILARWTEVTDQSFELRLGVLVADPRSPVIL